jgi:hypothetical protein
MYPSLNGMPSLKPMALLLGKSSDQSTKRQCAHPRETALGVGEYFLSCSISQRDLWFCDPAPDLLHCRSKRKWRALFVNIRSGLLSVQLSLQSIIT